MSFAHDNTPRREQWALGRQPGDQGDLVGILSREGGPPTDELHLHVENKGTAATTLTAFLGRPPAGSVTVSGQPDDADTVVIDDGINAAVTFEFDSNASVVETATLRAVVIGVDMRSTLANLAAAINAAPTLEIRANLPAGFQNFTVDLVGTKPDNTNTALTGTDIAAVQTLVGLVRGTGVAKNMRIDGADVASVVVEPGASINATLELALTDPQDWVSFYATGGDATPLGSLTLSYWHGDLVRRERWADFIDPALRPAV